MQAAMGDEGAGPNVCAEGWLATGFGSTWLYTKWRMPPITSSDMQCRHWRYPLMCGMCKPINWLAGRPRRTGLAAFALAPPLSSSCSMRMPLTTAAARARGKSPPNCRQQAAGSRRPNSFYWKLEVAWGGGSGRRGKSRCQIKARSGLASRLVEPACVHHHALPACGSAAAWGGAPPSLPTGPPWPGAGSVEAPNSSSTRTASMCSCNTAMCSTGSASCKAVQGKAALWIQHVIRSHNTQQCMHASRMIDCEVR